VNLPGWQKYFAHTNKAMQSYCLLC